jgi:hypothetical protein
VSLVELTAVNNMPIYFGRLSALLGVTQKNGVRAAYGARLPRASTISQPLK